jgi:hypothetical protein
MPAISEMAASYKILNSQLLVSQKVGCFVFRCRLWRGGYGINSSNDGMALPIGGVVGDDARDFIVNDMYGCIE